jgi:hypothetical protein
MPRRRRRRLDPNQGGSPPLRPAGSFHEYRFEYAPDAIGFYANGQLMKEWTDGLPTDSMKLYVNVWYPTWLGDLKPNKDKHVLVASIRHAGP